MNLAEITLNPSHTAAAAFKLFNREKFDEIGTITNLTPEELAPKVQGREVLFFLSPFCTDARVLFALVAHLVEDLTAKGVDTQNIILLTAILDGVGNTPHDHFPGLHPELTKLEHMLQAAGVTHIKTVVGFSIGGVVATFLFTRQHIPINYAFIDSAPLFDGAPLLANGMLIGIMGQKRMAHTQPEKFLSSFSGPYAPAGHIMLEHLCLITEDNIKAYIDACANAGYPQIAGDRQNHLYIRYGATDLTNKGMKRAKTKYPFAHFQELEGLGHVEGLAVAPNNYAEWIVSHAWA